MRFTALILLVCLVGLIFSCQPKPKDSIEISNNNERPPLPGWNFEELPRLTHSHLRGLHALSEKIVWVSGSEGAFLRSVNGEHFESKPITGYKHLDFRDVQAFSADTGLVMAAGSTGLILQTTNGGDTWQEVYRDEQEGVFLDAIAFDGSDGYCIGDPIGPEMYILKSVDRGATWSRIAPDALPDAIPGEGSYAASGSTLIFKDGLFLAAYGGPEGTRIVRKMKEEPWEVVTAPLKSGEGCGIFSMSFEDASNGVAVGGCYLDSTSNEMNTATTSDGGQNWYPIENDPPLGYRSAVDKLKNGPYVTTGRTGIDFSFDPEISWEHLSDRGGYFTLSTSGHLVYLAGRNGKMATISRIGGYTFE